MAERPCDTCSSAIILIIITELFSLSLTVEMLYVEICQSRHFSKGVGHFECKFQTEGASPTYYCRCQKTRVIALSCGIKISAVHCLVFVTKHTCDRWSDRHADRITTPKTVLAQLRHVVKINKFHIVTSTTIEMLKVLVQLSC